MEASMLGLEDGIVDGDEVLIGLSVGLFDGDPVGEALGMFV